MKLNRKKPAHLELELTMRDVLGNLEELTLLQSYQFIDSCFELLSIETEPSEPPASASAAIITFPSTA